MHTPRSRVEQELNSAIGAAAGRIHDFQVRSTRLFSVGVDILNAARLLEAMGFELQLLARNGMVQAAHLGKALGRQGDALLALARILSDAPGTMTPLIERLGEHCRTIASHTATCSSLARRYLQLFKALAIVLANECPTEEQRRFIALMRNTNLFDEGELRRALRLIEEWQLPTRMTLNLLLILDRCAVSLRGIAEQSHEVRQAVMEVNLALRAIERTTGTVSYLGMNVAIEAAHMAKAGEQFQRLAAEIEQTMKTFAERLAGIRLSAERGEVQLAELGA